MSGNRYTVHVIEENPSLTRSEQRQLANTLGLEQAQFERLLERIPGPITREIPERTALALARTLRGAGFVAFVRPADPPAPQERQEAETPTSPQPPPQPKVTDGPDTTVPDRKRERNDRALDTNHRKDLEQEFEPPGFEDDFEVEFLDHRFDGREFRQGPFDSAGDDGPTEEELASFGLGGPASPRPPNRLLVGALVVVLIVLVVLLVTL